MDFRTRVQWGAAYDPVASGRPLMKGLPVATIYVHHTVTQATNDPNKDMRTVEAVDLARFGVASYSYVCHPLGVVLEGMANYRGAHTINNANQSQNDISFGISAIGNYMNDTPTDALLQAYADCINLIIKKNGWLQDNWVLKGHRDIFATACPGANLYPLLGKIRSLVDAGSQPQPQPTQEIDVIDTCWSHNDTRYWQAGRGKDDAVWLQYYDTSKSTFVGPYSLGGAVASGLSIASADWRIDVSFIGQDGHMYHKWCINESWSQTWQKDGDGSYH